MAVLTITKENFNTEVLNSHGIVLVDFSAEHRCPPCRMLAPVLDEISEENQDIVIGKVNTDENFELCIQFGIRSVPTMLLFKDGKLIDQAVGFMPKEDVLKFIAQ